MKITRDQIIIAIVVAIVGFILVNRFMRKPKKVETAPAALVVAADLKDMKYQILNSPKTEMYRSGDSTAHTIAGTILEQAIDVIVAVLEQPEVVKVGNSLIASKEDADNVATMIEEVGKDVAKSIKDTPADKFVRDGPNVAYKALQNSLKDEVDKTDIWYPIVQRFLEAHGSKAPFNMNDRQREQVKNASPDRINESRDMIKNSIDEGFGIRAGESRSRSGPPPAGEAQGIQEIPMNQELQTQQVGGGVSQGIQQVEKKKGSPFQEKANKAVARLDGLMAGGGNANSKAERIEEITDARNEAEQTIAHAVETGGYNPYDGTTNLATKVQLMREPKRKNKSGMNIQQVAAPRGVAEMFRLK